MRARQLTILMSQILFEDEDLILMCEKWRQE